MRGRLGSAIMLAVLVTVSVVPTKVAQTSPLGSTERDLDILPSHGSVAETGNSVSVREHRVPGLVVLPTPTPEPTLHPTPTKTPEVKPKRMTVVSQVTGKASWFRTGPDGPYAAACWGLRKAMGRTWRGDTVLVVAGKRAIEVRLTDFCASRTKLIDLSDQAFKYLAPLSRGVIQVTVGW